MTEELDALANSHWAIQIRTKHPDGTTFSGIILESKKRFLIIQNIVSFEYDGIVILPRKWIKGIRNDKYDRCVNDILRKVMALDDVSTDAPYFGLNDLREIISCLRTEGIWPAIEILHKGEASLYMGPIIHVSKNSFRIHCYDAAGEWEKEYELEYKEVFKIEIDSKYVRRFNEYMRLKKNI